MAYIERLMALKEDTYGDFQAKLTPGIPREQFIGVRVPLVKQLAKELYKEGDYYNFLIQLPHYYFEENLLHGLIISEEKDYELCVKYLNDFLPYVDNWAVCDSTRPKVFKKKAHKEKLIEQAKIWIADDYLYTSRFGIELLMTHFLDDDFKPEYLELPAAVETEEYYLQMMVAWYFATALAKQWDATIPYIEERRLSPWIHNKSIQKARESYRITPEQKEYLKGLK